MMTYAGKILHLSSVHVWNDVRILYRECSSLARHGYDVTLAIPRDKQTRINQVTIEPLPPYRSKLQRLVRTLPEATKKVLSSKYEILHFHDPELIPLALIAKARGKTVIFDVHENMESGVLEKQWVPFKELVNPVFMKLVRIAAKKFKIILAEESYKSYFSQFSSDPRLVMNFPQTEHLKSSCVKRKFDYPNLFYIGGVTEERGILNILKAIQLLVLDGHKVSFECVGPIQVELNNNQEFQKLKKELEPYVVFHGRMDIRDGYKIAEKCNLGLATLLPLKNYLNSYPTKLFEYMAVGLPYLTSDFPLYQKLTGDTEAGFTVDPTDPMKIKKRIVGLFSQTEPLVAASKAGPEKAKESYNWTSQEQELLKLYDEILSS